ncbi:MAG: hypothetical protein K0Q87_2859, partial [Neobacillus sp.]|nr:hypothetical protein [Neobacillus sp.]
SNKGNDSFFYAKKWNYFIAGFNLRRIKAFFVELLLIKALQSSLHGGVKK